MDEDLFLILRMRAGDDRAVDSFVRKYYPSILKFCRCHISDPMYAEDMTQETFVRFFQNFGEYRHSGRAANYLYTIASNAIRDLSRKNREDSLEDLSEEPAEMPEMTDLRLDLRRAMGSLPPELQAVSELSLVRGFTQKEISRILGIGLPLVKYRIARAKKLLQTALREEEDP